MNADPDVMEFFPSTLDRAASDAFVDAIEATFDSRGLGLWAVEGLGIDFHGYVGLWPATFDAAFNPSIEIGWRLTKASWGKGIATEAANRVVEDAFGRLMLDELVSFTAVLNTPSRAVMERIGMQHVLDFDHPNVSPDSELRRHVLYRLTADDDDHAGMPRTSTQRGSTT